MPVGIQITAGDECNNGPDRSREPLAAAAGIVVAMRREREKVVGKLPVSTLAAR